MTVGAALAVSTEELGVLWTIAGRPLFGYIPWPELDTATFAAVARGLVARGFIRGDDEPAMAPDIERLLGVALFADQMLRCTINQFGPVDPATRQEVFWRKGETLVHHTPSPTAGTHRFAACDRTDLDAILADMVDFEDHAAPPAGALSFAVREDEYIDALETVGRDGTAAAAQRHPALAGYLEAMQDTRPLTSIEVLDDQLAGGELSLMDAQRHGLWIERRGEGATIVVAQVDAATAREQVADLVRTFG